MIRSMTGFGHASLSSHGYRVSLDIKTVNHRYCDISVRMPKEWMAYEDTVKKAVLRYIKRGRADCFVTIERETVSNKSVSVDWALVDGYMQAAEQIQKRHGIAGGLVVSDLLRLPDLLSISEQRAAADDALVDLLTSCMEEALKSLNGMRESEGAHLAGDLTARLSLIDSLNNEMMRYAPEVVRDYAAKLRQRIQDLLSDQIPADEQRLAAEIALFADRSNVDEEMTRLQSHINQFRQLLGSREPVGRKLDFLIQEMNREANTIGSKAGHIEVSNRVIELKAELEKMREQIQNIE
ncbi:YicC/YloC family endoribonuclease [Paenibacillus lutrae]|uniref:YicC family protein n=1 Tax=Paenibacillus lutrae TaxID=2078573 RepID=A0A7X3FGK6_9BACL|nr:YicC/YloC family endoribonuclease [Paenibacillus lutrae]MVO99237.1 YicC family protein [Paenibacillus lutrae]